MKNNIYKLTIIASVTCIGMMVLSSCKKDWLEPKPLSIYVPENTLVDIQGFRSAISSISNNIRPEWYGDASPNISEQIFSEESVEGTDDKAGPAQNLDVQIRPDAQLNHTDFNKIGYFWDRQYVTIRAANVVISRLPAATAIPDADKNVLLGQAYFLRAYAYYRLVHQFGDIPCPIKEVTSAKTDFATVKREVILLKMKEDLDFAVKWVPWVTDKGDVNRGAVYHQLAKINLALGLFDEAITAATAVINQGTFKLMTNRFGVDAGVASRNVTWDLHRPDNKSAAANTEGLYIVTDRFGTPGAFAGGIKTMRNAAPGISIGTNIVTNLNKAGISAASGVEIDLMNIYGRGIGRCRSTPYYYKDIWDDVKDQRHDSTSGNWMYMENLRYSNPALKGV
ncbi:MAG: RagB/SusD family nutrient uptake outer membrane protein, partial [Bacteroidota bacterium]